MKRSPRHIGLILSLALCCGGTFSAPAQISASQTVAIGNQLLDSEDYMLAIQYFNKAIKAKPYLCEPYYLRGLSKMMLGDYAGAESDCSQAIEINKYKQEPYRIRGISRLKLGKDSLALADFISGLNQTPQERTFLYLKGIAESRLNLADKSDETFALLQRLYPHFTHAYTARARNFISKGNFKEAVSELNKACANDKYTPEAYILLAKIAADNKDWKATEKYLSQAITLLPQHENLYINRGVARAAANKRNEAIADFRTALEINPDNKTAADNITFMRSASSMGKQTLSFVPVEIQDLAFLTTNSGRLNYIDSKQKPEGAGMFALTFTHPYNNLHPIKYPEPELDSLNSLHRLPSPLYLSKTADEMPDAEQAVALFAFAEAPLLSRDVDCSILLGRAVAFAMLKNYEDAIPDLDLIIAADPNLTVALMERAFIRVAQAKMQNRTRSAGNNSEMMTHEAFNRDLLLRALEDIDSAIMADSTSAYAWYNRGVINELLGDNETAIHDYSQAILLYDSLAEAYLNRGLLHLQQGDKTAARADLSHAGELGLSRAYAVLKNL